MASIKRGIPVIANFQHYSQNQGEGHYAVIIGFTKSGEVVIADAARESGQGFERVPFPSSWSFGMRRMIIPCAGLALVK